MPAVLPGGVVCHFDGAVRSESHGAVGFVIRDDNGGVLMVRGISYEGLVDPMVIELMAFRDALRWCVGAGLAGVRFVGDAKVVIDKIHARITRDAKAGAIFQEVYILLDNHLDFSVQFVGRQNNRVAHMVAKKILDLFSTGPGMVLISRHGCVRRSSYCNFVILGNTSDLFRKKKMKGHLYPGL
ncbi:unnamed protein product [Linum trigynum]|uniref:RNase H type-1 domain-containing protein n=1 Tax=Linum trigynum TaxID=586398 RepID=A0AAV2DHG1_9ROSI